MDNLYLWLGIGLSLIIIGIIYFSIRTTKSRAREVEELNQYFPETNESVTVESMRGKLRRSQRTGAEVTVGVEEDKHTQEEEVEGKVTGDSSDKGAIEPEQEVQAEDHREDSEKPVRYRRSIFHSDHLKKDQDKSDTE